VRSLPSSAGRLLLLLSVGCGGGTAASRGVPTTLTDVPGRHPNGRYLVREIEVTDTIWLRPDDHHEDAEFASQLTQPPGSDAVSFSGAGSSDALGGADAVLALPDGRRLVLDQQANIVRIVSPTGSQVGVVGRPGRGPGDFFNPLSMALDASGNLYVGDLTRRLQRFRPDGSGFVLDTVINTTVSPRGLCVIDSLIVVHGVDMTDPSVIWLYDLHGKLLRSFGSAYRSPLAILNYQYGSGRIACLIGARRIAYLSGGMPELRIFTPEGKTERLMVIADFRPGTAIEMPNAGYRSEVPPGGQSDDVKSLVAMPDGLLIQVGTATTESRRARDEYATLTSVLVSPRGRGVLKRTTAGALVATAAQGRPTFTAADPAPAVVWAR
jgi:hypothetical protein